MKVGILTINDYNNYGNRLQNYAVQEILKSQGFEVETIIHELNKGYINNLYQKKSAGKVQKLKRIMTMSHKEKLIYLKRKLSHKNENPLKEIRINSFLEFTTNNIVETNFKISDGNISATLHESYDYLVTGSDQVWNPHFRGAPTDFLTFAPNHKRIALSPSFGVSEIPPTYVPYYKTWLSEMSHLSVREHAGAKLIKGLTGRDAEVLIDPTLMLNKKKWLSIAKPAVNKPKSNYILTYFLGGVPLEYQSRINGIAKENDLKIINLADEKDKDTYTTGPSEFIDFINTASVFCTDSFHGIAFSILMETPFIIFERASKGPSMNSRIETILSTFKLHSRLDKNIKTNEQVFEAEYSHIIAILEQERKKVEDYLKATLKIEIK